MEEECNSAFLVLPILTILKAKKGHIKEDEELHSQGGLRINSWPSLPGIPLTAMWLKFSEPLLCALCFTYVLSKFSRKLESVTIIISTLWMKEREIHSDLKTMYMI